MQEEWTAVNDMVVMAFGALVLAGAVLTVVEREPYRKLISLGIMIGGAIPFIINRGLLDVAIAVALIAPLSTLFILMVCGKGEQ